MAAKIEVVELDRVKDANLILGQSHFIKTVEDLYEALAESAPNIKFGLAFCESSGPCLIRHAGNDPELEEYAIKNAMKIGAGHCFVIYIRDAWPINVLNRLKMVSEVCTIYCATMNPVQVIVAETELGRAILGVVDGEKPKGVEQEEHIRERKEFLRKIGYKC